jgi:hypothetical protein
MIWFMDRSWNNRGAARDSIRGSPTHLGGESQVTNLKPGKTQVTTILC